MNRDAILEVKHLSKSFGANAVLKDIDFVVHPGDVTSIIGSSGSGKSTLLRCINLLETPTSGDVVFHGDSVVDKKVNAAAYRAKVGMVFQSFNLFNNMSVLENCIIGQTKVLKRNKEETKEKKKTEKSEKAVKKKAKKDKKDEKIEELNDRLMRNLAEFENFRNRSEKEKSAMFEIGAKSVVEKMLPVVDNLERGFDGLSDEEKETPFAKGIEAVYKQLLTGLEEIGVTPIEAVGKEFDPNFHNAVMHDEDDSDASNQVIEEFQKGYMYKDSVVRHSMVKVLN